MKKLISAASAMVMAASMVGTAVPFATGAAEASKGLEIKTYLNKDGSEASTTIDTTSADVTIPVGVYYVEKTADTRSVRASWCVSSANGDASVVKFSDMYMPNSKYFASAQSVAGASGSFELTNLPAFAGTITSGRNGAVFSPAGEYTCNVAEGQASQNVTTAWGSIVWTKPVTEDYAWTGASSDAFPFYVFDVTFPKGTPAGTYTIDFVDMSDDPAHPDIKTTMIEGDGGTVYTPGAGNLTTKALTITVSGEPVQQPTTQAPTEPATQAPTEPATQAPTKAPSTSGEPSVTPGDAVMGDFVIEGEEVTVTMDEVKAGTYFNNIGFTAHANGHKSATMVCELDALPAGITVKMNDPSNYAFENINPTWSLSNRTYRSETRDGNQDPQDVLEDCVINFDFTLPADIQPGDYEITFERFHIVEQAQVPVKEGNATVKAAVIHVVGDPVDQPTTAPTQPATDAPTSAPTQGDQPTTTPTQAPTPGTGDGKILYGDTNNNGVVDIADVVVLNKWLNDHSAYDLTAQGKLNADCCDPTGGDPDENDSKAIIWSIVHKVKQLPCSAADLK